MIHVSGLTNLTCLKLTRIPARMDELVHLSHLNLSYNRLTYILITQDTSPLVHLVLAYTYLLKSLELSLRIC